MCAWSKTDPTDNSLLVNFPSACRANWVSLEALTTSALQITNAKVAVGADIVESKLLFSGSGHGHIGGTDGKQIALATAVSGILPIANGGTGAATGPVNSDTVDSIHMATTATANYGLALDANAKFPSGTSLLGNNISISTGTVVNGGTIPLPSGYTQTQCKWIVAPYLCGTYGDPHTMYAIKCQASVDRVVTICGYYTYVGWKCTGNHTASYIIIGIY